MNVRQEKPVRVQRSDMRLFLLALALLAVVSIFSLHRIFSIGDELELNETNAAVQAELYRLQFAIAEAEKAQLAYFLIGGERAMISSEAERVITLLEQMRPDLEEMKLPGETLRLMEAAGARWRRRHVELERAANLYGVGNHGEAISLALGIDDTRSQEMNDLLAQVTDRLFERRETQRQRARRGLIQALIAPIIAIGIIAGFGLHYTRRYSFAQAESERSIRSLTATKTDLENRVLQRNAELEQLANELRESSAHKDQFLAMLGHELRNPLAPIVSSAEYLLHGDPDPEEIRNAARVINAQCRRMNRLVNDLMDIGQISSGEMSFDMRVVDLRAIIDSVARASIEMAAKRGVDLKLKLPREPVLVRGDGDRIGQITENLLNNALKFTGPDDRIVVELKPDQNRAKLVVADTGEGMETEIAEHVFEPFFRTENDHQRGLGLGLAIVRDVVSAHEGSVQASSEGPGRGTRVEVALPIHDGPAPEITAPVSVVPANLAPQKFLVVDDYAANAESLADLLRATGHNVILAENGETALEHFKQEEPDVVLLDLGLPDIDGVEVGRIMLQVNPQACVIAVTGMGHESIVEKTRETGFTAHLTKPVRVALLLKTVADAKR